ncbi:MAG: OstA family protein [Chitinophagaceae bacterium]|nr:OstA family protein [Chitinophagaceae bacterium]MBP7109624.1 OstA family protein [Chitinophagaceae bacterium]MBP7315853.1 OstA family protein [Chitinophagaceae bacterium]
MRKITLLICLFLAILLLSRGIMFAQIVTPIQPTSAPTADSSLLVEILPGVRKLEFRKVNDSTQLQILAGNVKLKQGTSLFFCDSCVINNNTNTFEAWGNVHVKDADTVNIYSNHLRYLITKRLAYLDGGVRLTDGKGTLTTPDLEYDMTTDIGIFKKGGKVVNKKTVLTSQEGYYYAGLRDVYFKKNVVLNDPAYKITTDSLLYNTQSQTARFIAQTLIKDSSGRTIETKEGFYNIGTGKAEFGGRPIIKDGKLTITANNIINDDSTGISQARGNVIIIDTVQKTTILAGEVYRDNKNDRILATRKPLMIIKQDNDSIYVTADTLFSARLSDLYTSKDSLTKDTIKGIKVVDVKTDKKSSDSTNRYFEAYRNVRIFSDSMQAISDSMFYSFRDSTFRLFQKPVVWSKESQITGDTIYMFTKNKKADKLEVFENSFMVNRIDPEVYNQVKATRMDGYFKEGQLDSIRAAGLAETIYYIQDDDSAYTGINESRCDIIDIYFGKETLEKVVFRSNVSGTIWPMKLKDPKEMRLTNFIWLEDRRPKTKFDLFD